MVTIASQPQVPQVDRQPGVQFGQPPLWVHRGGNDAVALYNFLSAKWGGPRGGVPIFASPKRMAAELGVHVSTIYRWLRALREVGAITVKRSRRDDGKLGRATYFLTWYDPAPLTCNDPSFRRSRPHRIYASASNHTDSACSAGPRKLDPHSSNPPASGTGSCPRPSYRPNKNEPRGSEASTPGAKRPVVGGSSQTELRASHDFGWDEPLDERVFHGDHDGNDPTPETSEDYAGLFTFGGPYDRKVPAVEEVAVPQVCEQLGLFDETSGQMSVSVDKRRARSDTGGTSRRKDGTEKKGSSPARSLIAYWLGGREVKPDRRTIAIMGKVIKRCLQSGASQGEVQAAFDDLMARGVDGSFVSLARYFNLPGFRVAVRDYETNPLFMHSPRVSSMTAQRKEQLRLIRESRRLSARSRQGSPSSRPVPVSQSLVTPTSRLGSIGLSPCAIPVAPPLGVPGGAEPPSLVPPRPPMVFAPQANPEVPPRPVLTPLGAGSAVAPPRVVGRATDVRQTDPLTGYPIERRPTSSRDAMAAVLASMGLGRQ